MYSELLEIDFKFNTLRPLPEFRLFSTSIVGRWNSLFYKSRFLESVDGHIIKHNDKEIYQLLKSTGIFSLSKLGHFEMDQNSISIKVYELIEQESEMLIIEKLIEEIVEMV